MKKLIPLKMEWKPRYWVVIQRTNISDTNIFYINIFDTNIFYINIFDTNILKLIPLKGVGNPISSDHTTLTKSDHFLSDHLITLPWRWDFIIMIMIIIIILMIIIIIIMIILLLFPWRWDFIIIIIIIMITWPRQAGLY